MLINETNYVEKAERVIEKLSSRKDRYGKPVSMVTTSKLRNLLAMSADIYNEVLTRQEDALDAELVGRIEYLRVRFIYEAGREPKVKELVDESRVLDILKEINGSRRNYILFSRYMESLVAFRKYYGKDRDD